MTVAEADLDLLEGDLDERVRALGLEQNSADLALQGYTVVENIAPLEFIDRIRERILELIEEQRAAGNSKIGGGIFEESAWMLLGRGRVFEEAVCNPKLVALNELMAGKGFQLGVCGGTVKTQGGPALPMHTDHYDLREPYPIQCEGLTSLWTCDDWTEEGGATRLVPKSFKFRRAPLSGEADDRAIPLEAPKGSLLLWDGATWHGNCPRTIPGVRVSLHTPCKNVARRTLESYVNLPDEIVDRNPSVFARMIGREDPYGKQTPLSPPKELGKLREWLRADTTSSPISPRER